MFVSRNKTVIDNDRVSHRKTIKLRFDFTRFPGVFAMTMMKMEQNNLVSDRRHQTTISMLAFTWQMRNAFFTTRVKS
jgi:hypothetical protein